jgi:hypothetical protein
VRRSRDMIWGFVNATKSRARIRNGSVRAIAERFTAPSRGWNR